VLAVTDSRSILVSVLMGESGFGEQFVLAITLWRNLCSSEYLYSANDLSPLRSLDLCGSHPRADNLILVAAQLVLEIKQFIHLRSCN
jgi:hypothetical protein